jgi:hypothetical protein
VDTRSTASSADVSLGLGIGLRGRGGGREKGTRRVLRHGPGPGLRMWLLWALIYRGDGRPEGATRALPPLDWSDTLGDFPLHHPKTVRTKYS